jgi:hypothetical protein
MDANDSPTPDADETKRKFREALDRKQKNSQGRPDHLDGESAVNGTHERADHKREFRRKTG